MTASALSGVRPPQAHIGLPILWPEDIQGEDDGGTTGILGALDQRVADRPPPGRIQLERDGCAAS